MLPFTYRRAAVSSLATSVPSLLSASIRAQSTTATNTAATAESGTAEATTATNNTTPTPTAATATPTAATIRENKQWAVYRAPVWRLVGVKDHRRTRELRTAIAQNRLKRKIKKAAAAAKKTADAAAAADAAANKTVPTGTTAFVLNVSPSVIATKPDGLASVPAPAPSAANTFFFHGDKLGPRPLVILDEVIPHSIAEKLFAATTEEASSSAAVAAALSPIAKYSAVLTELAHRHGALSLPLVGPKGYETAKQLAGMPALEKRSFLDKYCDDVVTMLDALNVPFATIVGRSTGALVAAKMALLYPNRVGGIVVVDTPLVEKHWVDNAAARKELLAAADDVNVPQVELEFAARSLLDAAEGRPAGEGLEPATAVPYVGANEAISSAASSSSSSPAAEGEGAAAAAVISAFNKSLYENVIFSPNMVFPKSIVVPPSIFGQKNAKIVIRKHNASPLTTRIIVSRNKAASARFLSDLVVDPASGRKRRSPVVPYSRKSRTFAVAKGLYRIDKAYADPETLSAIRHPLLLLQPSNGAAADGNLHRQFFNLRKPTVISLGEAAAPAAAAAAEGGKNNKKGGGGKDGKGQKEEKEAVAAKGGKKAAVAAKSLFEDSISGAMAKQIAAFTNRFELDLTLAKRYEQAAADLLVKINNSTSIGDSSAAAAGGDSKKKKKGASGKK